MAINTSPNSNYSLMAPEIKKVRDSVLGSFFIKRDSVYLPHPSQVDTTSNEQIIRYNEYVSGAEFDEFTGYTKRVMLGKAKLDDIKFVPPSGLEYLAEDVDKDGLSMKGLIESCYGNILEVKWHLLVTDYKGLSELAMGETSYSAQDIKDANPRPVIKQYPRESVIDWNYERINGVMQLSYLLLEEIGSELDEESGSRTEVKSHLKLGLDEQGYYQQKRTDSTDGDSSFGERKYFTIGGLSLDFMPVSIACDEEFQPGKLPMQLGFLSPLATLALARYRVSAKYKEAMNAFIPSIHVMGVDQGVWETYKAVNERDCMASGTFSPNIWSGSKENPVTVELLEASGSLQQFIDYFEDNKNKVKAEGGVFKTDNSTARTATEILDEASSSAMILMPVANNVEPAIKWQIAYCAMFAGKVKKEDLADYVASIELNLPRDFGVSKLTVEEIKALLEVYSMGLLPRDEFLRIFELGGWSISTAEELLQKLEEGGGLA